MAQASSRMSSINSWTCANCTYVHAFLSARCVMCSELRGATRQQMRDFVAGKTLKKAKNSADGVAATAGGDTYTIDDDDEVEVVEVMEAPTVAQNAPSNGAATRPATVPGSSASDVTNRVRAHDSTSSVPIMNKENQKQPSVAQASQVPPPPANSFFAKRQPGAPAAAARKPCNNPYLNKKSANTSSSNGPAALNTTNNSAARKPPAVATTGPASAFKNDDAAWQHVSTATAQSRALPLHPPAPQRQSPTPVAAHPGQSRGPGAARSTNNASTPGPVVAGNALSLLKDAPPPASAARKKQQPKSPFVPKALAYSKGPVAHCPETIKTWIYPEHPQYPARQYQIEMTETAVHHNTIVSLPTGLGKTLIAAVVMYNYWRWFPTGKILFLAPTLPLVNQQVQACYKIMGIPASATAVMTGKLSREKRMEYWKERRVFYCTPQTVQKDLVEKSSEGEEESPVASSFANQVVCLVLDEAHKATGEYAYVKVVEQLEAAGAKFRVVGLSATPGTSIKAIQQVVCALRSSRIEARQEADPTVAPYLHEKISEIVIVPRNDSQRQVERQLTNMLTPMLESLRQQGAFRLNGNASLTPFQILQAKKHYLQRHGQLPGSLGSLFAATQALVSLRNDAHQSLGVIRNKLMRLKSDPQRGIMSTIVKGQDFKDLFDMVAAATSSGDNATLSQEHATIRNNPKLIKLSELLKEHFLRAQACDKSSRVIVFSQFRDSVSEIVLLLRTMEPAIRPHHFVGQGKPPKGNAKGSGKNPGDSRLNGMKQSEQQKVIQEFRNDVYNVLVCTCIGEEGLDIGEVDLIVNFDSLRSPIRMIQRTGRTGRARDGRVVCLLAEGQEQRMYEQSKQGEKTLMRALAKKSNFIMNAEIPLFPEPPKEMQTVTMEIGSQLHLSQVAGVNSVATRKSNGSKSTKFKLDSAQEQERQQRLGELVVLDTNATPWRTLRRVLIRHRSTRPSHGGRTMRILEVLERLGPTHETASNAGKTSRANAAIYNVFPIEKPPESNEQPKMPQHKSADTRSTTPNQLCSTNSSVEKLIPELPVVRATEDPSGADTVDNSFGPTPLHLPPVVPVNDVPALAEKNNSSPVAPIQNVQTTTIVANPLIPNLPQRPDGLCMDVQLPPEVSANNASALPEKNNRPAALVQNGQTASVLANPLIMNPPQRLDGQHMDVQLPPELPANDSSATTVEKNSSVAPIQNMQTATTESTKPLVPNPPAHISDRQRTSVPEVAIGENLVGDGARLDEQANATVGSLNSVDYDNKGVGGVSETNSSSPEPIFRLPTPPPSSSEDEGDEDEDSYAEQMVPDRRNDHLSPGRDECFNTADTAGSMRSKSPGEGISSQNPLSPDGANVSFRLPTQPSSSEDEDSSEDEEESPNIDDRALAPISPRIEGSTHDPDAEEGQDPGYFKSPSPFLGVVNDTLRPAEFAGDESDDEDIPLISLRKTKSRDIPLISLRTPKRRKSTSSEKQPNKSRKKSCEKSPLQSSKVDPDQRCQSSVSAPSDSSPSPEITARLKRKKRLFVVEDGASQLDPTFELVGPLTSSGQTPSNQAPPSARNVLQDTPDDLAARIQSSSRGLHAAANQAVKSARTGQGTLTDTPLTLNPSPSADTSQITAASLSCQVCFSRESLDEDPLILCDGCDLGFHKSCFSVEVSLDSSEPWFCDMCTSRNGGDIEEKSCMLCGINDGTMKRQGIGWCHPLCEPFLDSNMLTSRPCSLCSCDGGARCFSCTTSMHPYCAIHKPHRDRWTIVSVKPANPKEEGKATLFCPAHVNNANKFIAIYAADGKPGPLPSIRVVQTKNISAGGGRSPPKPKRLKRSKKPSTDVDEEIEGKKSEASSRLSRLEKLQRRRAGASKFVLEEADIGSEEESDGEEDDNVRHLEDDELSHDSFINDSIELTQHFSQDNLAEVDPDASTEVDFHHRALDAERERGQQYRTPLLNRRMNRAEDSQFSSSSQKGLGNMNFVRSVLEHHRQGGRSEDIEEYYHQVVNEDQQNVDLSQPSTA